MNIVVAWPPMIDEIAAVFPVRHRRDVIFTWGDTIYSPGGAHLITPALKAHEGVHYQRQGNVTAAIEAWWRHYLVDIEFRLGEELPAHRAEYKQFCSMCRDRNARSEYLRAVAARLSGDLYGNLISAVDARKRLAA